MGSVGRAELRTGATPMKFRNGFYLAVVIWAVASPGNWAAAEPPLPGTEPLTWTRRHRLAHGGRRGPLPPWRDREVGRAAAPRSGIATCRARRTTTPRSSPTASGCGISWACAIRACRSSRRNWSAPTAEPALRRARGRLPRLRRALAGLRRRARRRSAPDARRGSRVANVIAIPDADQTPEMLAGLVDGRAGRVAVRPAIGRKRLPRAGARR